MNKKFIAIISVVLLVFIIGFAAVTIFDLKLPFAKEQEFKEYTLPIEGTITTNIKDSNSYVKCEMVLTVNDEAEYTDMLEKSYTIKDTIIEVLRSMEEHEYYQDDLQIILNDKIIKSLKENYSYSHITKVFFEQLITQ